MVRSKKLFGVFELSSNNNREHVQGYIEFTRTVRFAYVSRIFPEAHWKNASGSSLDNYKYCTKQGYFCTLGDFCLERCGKTSASNDNGRKAPVPLVLAGLLNPKLASQVRVSREFSERHMYYDRTLALLKGIERKLSLFYSFKGKNYIHGNIKC